MSSQQGDLVFVNTPDGGDLIVNAGLFTMDGGLQTAVYMSLFTREWWAGEYTGHFSRAAETLPLTSNNRTELERAASRDLNWLIASGVATAVSVSVFIRSNKAIEVDVTIDGSTAGRWTVVWEDFKIEPLNADA